MDIQSSGGMVDKSLIITLPFVPALEMYVVFINLPSLVIFCQINIQNLKTNNRVKYYII